VSTTPPPPPGPIGWTLGLCGLSIAWKRHLDSVVSRGLCADHSLRVDTVVSVVVVARRDRTNITLPGDQATLVTRVRAAVPASTSVVVVMVHGGSLDITEVLSSSDAVLDAYYPGAHSHSLCIRIVKVQPGVNHPTPRF
jgi:hypothetical protein